MTDFSKCKNEFKDKISDCETKELKGPVGNGQPGESFLTFIII